MNLTTSTEDASSPVWLQQKCQDVYDLNTSFERCLFVQQNEDCHNDQGFISYIDFVFCGVGSPDFPTAILAFWLLWLFIALACTADNFLCPSLVVISKTLRLSQNVAGVTFLAFGNGAPDIISALAGIEQRRPSLVIGELFGAGVFVTMVVAGSVLMTRRFELTQRPFLRDIVFYLAAIYWTYYSFYRGAFHFGYAIGFIGLYLAYIAVVIFGHFFYDRGDLSTGAPKVVIEETEAGYRPGEGSLPTSPELARRASHRSRSLLRPDEDDWFYEHRVPRRRRHLSQSSLHHHHDHVIAVYTHRERVRRERRSRSVSPCGRARRREISIQDEEDIEAKRAVVTFAPELSEKSPLLSVPKHPFEEACGSGEASQEDDDDEHTPSGPVNEFLLHIFPIDIKEWSGKHYIKKYYEFVSLPINFLLLITIPVVDYDNYKNNWCRLLNCLHCITGPVFVYFMVEKDIVMITGVPLSCMILLVGTVLALVVFKTSKYEEPPRYHAAFAYAGFVVSVVWVYGLANEVVSLMKVLGIVAGASDTVLGLTVLSWGNSLGDFITNLSMARQGYTQMALSACFGGPLLNLLMGIGLSYTLALVNDPGKKMLLEYTNMVTLLSAALVLSLMFTLIAMLVLWFRSSKIHGISLIVMYCVFVLLAFLVELNVI